MAKNVGALVYPRRIKGEGPKDYLKITVATKGGQGVYQFFDKGKGKKSGTKAPTEEAQAHIYLAMPRQLSVSYGMSYQGVELGSIGGQLIAMAGDLAGGSADAASIATQISSAAGNALPEMALNVAAQGVNTAIGAMGFAGGVDANSISALLQGQILNPFREITFKGVNYRTHSFTVKMVAHSKEEANDIKKIVNTLRYYMHPSLTGGSRWNEKRQIAAGEGQDAQQTSGATGSIELNTSGNDRWLDVPSYFDLSFIRMQQPQGQKRIKINQASEITDIYRPGACVLQSLNVNFSPDGQYVSTPDGYVMAVQIQMSFKETVMLHRGALKELNEY